MGQKGAGQPFDGQALRDLSTRVRTRKIETFYENIFLQYPEETVFLLTARWH